MTTEAYRDLIIVYNEILIPSLKVKKEDVGDYISHVGTGPIEVLNKYRKYDPKFNPAARFIYQLADCYYIVKAFHDINRVPPIEWIYGLEMDPEIYDYITFNENGAELL